MSPGSSFTGMSSPPMLNPIHAFGASSKDSPNEASGSATGTANDAETPVTVTSTAPALATRVLANSESMWAIAER